MSLPIVHRPLTDEPMDSWLSHHAHVYGLPLSRFIAWIGLRPSADRYPYSARLRPADARLLMEAFGTDHNSLCALTMSRWANLGLEPGYRLRGGGPLCQTTGTRYCPECLVERDGRWKIEWYLLWSFMCRRHNRFLLAHCPHCDKRHGTGSAWMASAKCLQHVMDDATNADTKPATPAATETQGVLDAVLDGAASPPAFGHQHDGATWLQDAAALTRVSLRFLGEDAGTTRFTGLLGGEQTRAWDRVLSPDIESPLRKEAAMQTLLMSPAATGFAITVALKVLSARSIPEGREAIEWIPKTQRQRIGRESTHHSVSGDLGRVTAGRSLESLVRCRLRQANGTGPRRGARAPLDPRSIPSSLWPERTPAGPLSPLRRAAMAVALLCVDTKVQQRVLAAELGYDDDVRLQIAADLRRALKDSRYEPLVESVLILQRQLCRLEPPIDYARRRHLMKEPPSLGRREVLAIARETGHRRTPRSEAVLNMYVYEQFTGSDPLMHTNALTLPGPWRLAYRSQRHAFTHHLPASMDAVLTRTVQRHRLNEPVSWTPRLLPDWRWDLRLNEVAPVPLWPSTPPRDAARPTVPDGPYPGTVEELAARARAGHLDLQGLAPAFQGLDLVAAATTITSAAAQASMGQSTLSRRLARLDAALGGPCLQPAKRGTPATLTPLGRRALDAWRDSAGR